MIETIMKEIEINYAEGEFRKEIDPPYAVYMRTNDNLVCADGKIIQSDKMFVIELYYEKGDLESEIKIERVLNSHGIIYSKSVLWIGGAQQTYENIYTFKIKEEK